MIITPEITREAAGKLLKSIEEKNYRQAALTSRNLSASRIANLLMRFRPEETLPFLELLEKRRTGRVLASMEPEFASTVITRMKPEKARELARNIPPDNIIDILEKLDEDLVEYISSALNKKVREHLDKISSYPRGSAGRIMSPHFLTVNGETTSGETLESLLSGPAESERAPYIYVLGQDRSPIGVVSVKDLLRVNPDKKTKEVMNPNLISVRVDDSAREAALMIRNRRLSMLPVINREGYISGVITFDDAMKALSNEAASLITSTSAVTAEESFFTPPVKAVRGRLPWMAANVFLNMGAVAVITGFEETIAAVAVLAAFIPMITDMGGNVGIQSLSVAIRSIALGETRRGDFRKAIKKEAVIGMINGISLGLLFSVIAFLLRGNPYLGLLAGAALGINVLAAGIAGGTLPFIIKALGRDPAMMTGPVLTTITDITGVSIYLGLSTVFIRFLL